MSFLYHTGKPQWTVAALGTLPSEEKGKLRSALVNNIDENGYPVFGSIWNFMHGSDTAYHPAQVFAGSDFHPMLIGAGYYQSLSHATTLASIAEGMTVKKAALILSPQWFRRPELSTRLMHPVSRRHITRRRWQMKI